MQNSHRTAFGPIGNHGGTKVWAHTSANTLRLCPLLSQPLVTGGQCPTPVVEQTHTNVTDPLLRAGPACGLGGREDILAA